ncbi:CAP domain-containing protein [Nitrosomonas mobilis]|uniref:SCP-like extracellular n=1 Tax=Nitrosomonas mobilis TaxID=51642 RepID=A0A1G5SHZ1_9PROT|nr:CAP domain-containing protein [Nitrosomonas mobilis]SCZ86835.1 SCP-like extracellular [Nitrosomonas mobilis]
MSHKIIMVSIIVIMSFPAYALNVAQQAEMVVAHNIYRAEVGAPPIKYSGSLATTAQAWADNLKTNKSCNLEHSKGSGLGENIFWAGAVTWSDGKIGKQDVTPTKVTDSWGSEKADYIYSSNSCRDGKICGHYTQVVWSETTEIGCGTAVCDDSTQVWVCNYAPAGNMAGEKPY